MIDPSEIVENLVDALRDIPDLVTEVGGDANRVFAYHDKYPERSSLALAIHQMPAPSIMVAWRGTDPSTFGGVDVWRHAISMFLRAGEYDSDPPTGYHRLFRLITRGVPTSIGQPMINATIHQSCNPMDVPSIRRDTDAEGLDYFEVTTSFIELGDD